MGLPARKWFGNERQNSSITIQPDDPTISFGQGTAVLLCEVVAIVLGCASSPVQFDLPAFFRA